MTSLGGVTSKLEGVGLTALFHLLVLPSGLTLEQDAAKSSEVPKCRCQEESLSVGCFLLRSLHALTSLAVRLRRPSVSADPTRSEVRMLYEPQQCAGRAKVSSLLCRSRRQTWTGTWLHVVYEEPTGKKCVRGKRTWPTVHCSTSYYMGGCLLFASFLSQGSFVQRAAILPWIQDALGHWLGTRKVGVHRICVVLVHCRCRPPQPDTEAGTNGITALSDAEEGLNLPALPTNSVTNSSPGPAILWTLLAPMRRRQHTRCDTKY